MKKTTDPFVRGSDGSSSLLIRSSISRVWLYSSIRSAEAGPCSSFAVRSSRPLRA